MAAKDDDLADRFKRAVEDHTDLETSRRESAQRTSIDVESARIDLFARLTAFAQQVQHIEARNAEDALVLVYGERRLRFLADTKGVTISYEGWPATDTHRAWPDPDLDGRWVLLFRRHGREERMPLFERGIEELLVHGLGLPRPEESTRGISPRTAAALLGGAKLADLPSAGRVEPVDTAPGEAEATPRKRRDL